MKMTQKVKIALRSFLVSLLWMPMLSMAQTVWEEDKHYKVIAEKVSEDKRVREIFSFWCPHCLTFEPVVEQLQKSLTSDVTFTKAHVNFLGGASREAQDDATRAMLAAKALKQDKLFNAAFFNAVQKERKTINGMDDILQVFAAAGGDAEKLKKMANSFGIKGQVRKNNQLIRGVNSVPTFIVNNKYQAQFTRDMTPDSFIQLILWLLEQP